MATGTKEVKAVAVNIRIMDDFALVPSASGPHCYHVAIEHGLSAHCTCPDHARRARVCKHMKAVDGVLAGRAERVGGRDLWRADLVPQTRTAPRAETRGGAVGRVAQEVARLEQIERATMTPAAAAQEDAERAAEDEAARIADAMGDTLDRDDATDADWDASYGDPYYW
jgi:hypothetical protein